MSRRTGLGRHGRLEDAAGDPLDGLVNLFDIGIVLAVAFLVAGLGVTLEHSSASRHAQSSTSAHVQTLPAPPADAPRTRGHGRALGTVYRLSNGQLVYVKK